MSISHKKAMKVKRGRERKPRAKTFKSELKAEEFAKKNKLTNYKIVQLRFGLSKKFKVVENKFK